MLLFVSVDIALPSNLIVVRRGKSGVGETCEEAAGVIQAKMTEVGQGRLSGGEKWVNLRGSWGAEPWCVLLSWTVF